MIFFIKESGSPEFFISGSYRFFLLFIFFLLLPCFLAIVILQESFWILIEQKLSAD